MRLTNFVGPSYTSQSVNAAAERLCNWYPEVLESDNGKGIRVVYYPTPGLEVFAEGIHGPVRGMFEENGRAYAVIDSHFYEIMVDQTLVDRGIVKFDETPATISSNGPVGHQLFITSGLEGYIFDTEANTLVQITDVQFPHGKALQGVHTDGYFLVIVKDESFAQMSEIHNGLVWEADPISRSDVSDPLVAMAVVRREIWLFGQKTIEVFYNSGDLTFPFAPFPGKVMTVGCEATFSLVMADNDTLIFIGGYIGGGGQVFRIADAPQRISTHYIERVFQNYPTTADAIAYFYQDQGHTFYVVSFPTANATWVFDTLTGLWHERGQWNDDVGDYRAVRGWYHCFAFDQHLVGDHDTGTIYRQSIYVPTDDGTAIVRMRRAPHVSSELNWIFHQWAMAELETGLGLPNGQGSDPEIALRWSDDGGHTWRPYVTATAGLQGQYKMRAQWARLGRSRDRVYEIRVSDPIAWRFLDFYLGLLGGTS